MSGIEHTLYTTRVLRYNWGGLYTRRDTSNTKYEYMAPKKCRAQVIRASKLGLPSCWTASVYRKTWRGWGLFFPHHSIFQKIHNICSHILDLLSADDRSCNQLWSPYFHMHCNCYISYNKCYFWMFYLLITFF